MDVQRAASGIVVWGEEEFETRICAFLCGIGTKNVSRSRPEEGKTDRGLVDYRGGSIPARNSGSIRQAMIAEQARLERLDLNQVEECGGAEEDVYRHEVIET